VVDRFLRCYPRQVTTVQTTIELKTLRHHTIDDKGGNLACWPQSFFVFLFVMMYGHAPLACINKSQKLARPSLITMQREQGENDKE
jgi:hypothetical protein